eukprot:scaffold4599_cov138-Skeletonema_menzelii.AAC.3
MSNEQYEEDFGALTAVTPSLLAIYSPPTYIPPTIQTALEHQKPQDDLRWHHKICHFYYQRSPQRIFDGVKRPSSLAGSVLYPL